jgi:hypothetical protein
MRHNGFVGKSFKVESFTKHLHLVAWCVRQNFELCHKALLWRSMYKPWIIGCWQEDNRYDHVSTWMWGGWHSLHIRDGKMVSLNRCFQQLPIYFKNEVAMLFVMLRLMGGLKNDWIIFYLRWSRRAILEWRRCGGRFHVWFDQCEQGEKCVDISDRA